MRTDTGEIISEKEAKELNEKSPGLAIPMTVEPTNKQLKRSYVGKYDPCPCGSGKKFKFCCFSKK